MTLRTTTAALAVIASAGAAWADCDTVTFSDVVWTDITATTAATTENCLGDSVKMAL